LSRDEFIRVLHAENVLARKYFWPGCHRMEPYRSLYPYAGMFLPETERVAAQVIVLPTGTSMGEAQIATVCGIIRTATSQAGQVRAALAAKPEI
jgi:dTDP-4-amino-4,6-dideoxygalactose transaminase